MPIFKEIKEHLTARQVAEYYGLKVGRNGMACCPFHDDKHPSMKIDTGYYCFGCGAHGDAIGYVAQMYGMSQYDAACKLIEDFSLPIEMHPTDEREQEKARMKWRKEKEERDKIVHIKERFKKWCFAQIDILHDAEDKIQRITSYPYTSGKMLLVCFGVYMLASVLAGAIAMFLSCVLKNMVASAGVICGTVFVDLFFTIPHRFRVLSQLRFLTPIQVLINGSMTDPRLVHIGEHFWGTYQTAAILYVVLICVFCMLTYQAYMRVKR